MKAEIFNPYAGEGRWRFNELKSYKYDIIVDLFGDPTNCKLSYIHGIGNIANLSDEDKKSVIEFLLKKAKGCVIINTINVNIYEYIIKNYTVYYNKKIPIGYGKNYQYHVCIKNNITINLNCRDPEPDESTGLTKEMIKDKLTSLLRRYKRKTDLVDKFIESL